MSVNSPANFGRYPARRAGHGVGRLRLALLLSLLLHALLLSLNLEGQEFGLPGFAFPWESRRVEVPDLSVVLTSAPSPAVDAKRAAAPDLPPLPQAAKGQDAAAGLSVVAFKSAELPPELPAPAIVARSTASRQGRSRPKTTTAPALAKPMRPPKPFPAVMALEDSTPAEFAVPPGRLAAESSLAATVDDDGNPSQSRIEPPAVEAAAATVEPERREAENREAARQAAAREEQAQREAVDRAAVRIESERREAEKLEAARQAAARVEAERREAEDREAARQAAAREELAQREAVDRTAARIESERREAEKQEAARQAVAREEQAKREAVDREAARIESVRREAEKQEAAAREEQAQREAARVEAAREQDARRDAARRAMGRQLDEEAARRDAAQARTPLSPSASPLRRGRLFGRADPNAELILYAEAWSRKIQFNTGFEMVREAAKQAHTDPVVTVAIRSDGSIESVTFVRSSGVAAIDEAIRRIVQSQTPYLPFQPALARQFDVIEIRRTWYFDTAIRLY